MSSPDQIDDPRVIIAAAEEPGILTAAIEEALLQRIAAGIVEIHQSHGGRHFYGSDGKPLTWEVSVKTSLKDALNNGFCAIDNVSSYDQWIAALEEAAAFLRAEKAAYENEMATTMCAGCGHALSLHLHDKLARLDCAEPGCCCQIFQPLIQEVEAPERVLRLIRGGKDQLKR